MDMEIAAAFWTMGQLTPENLPIIAGQALSRGLDCPALRLLANETAPSMEECGPVFEQCLRELGIGIPSLHDAGHRLARFHAEKILSEKVSPYYGARLIRTLYYDIGQPESLKNFVNWSIRYEDLLTPEAVKTYGAKHCETVCKDIESKIINEAKMISGVVG